MKNDKKMFILIEAALAVMVLVVMLLMLWEKTESDLDKIAVIIQDADDNQWAAFKYGLKMAAKDQNVELVIVSTEGILTVEEEKNLIEAELENGADGVIVQPAPGEETEAMLQKFQKKVPVMLTEEIAKQDTAEVKLPKVEPDQYAMGQVLAQELLVDFSGNLEGKTLGILSNSNSCQALLSREQGFRDGLKNANPQICWTSYDCAEAGQQFSLEKQPKVDLLIALDDDCLTRAGECAASRELHGAIVYGIGNSTEAFYYLDIGAAECLVMPDTFYAGYQSVVEVAKELKNRWHQAQSQSVSHTVIRRETMFSKENQDILFIMS